MKVSETLIIDGKNGLIDTANVSHGSISVPLPQSPLTNMSPRNASVSGDGSASIIFYQAVPHAAQMRANQDHTRIKKIVSLFWGRKTMVEASIIVVHLMCLRVF